MWVNDRDPLKGKSDIIYQVPCSWGHFCIEKTRRAHSTSLREHKSATRSGELEKSDHCEGCWNCLHWDYWDNVKVLDEVANNTTLLIKEVLHICTTGSDTLNNRWRHHNLKLLDGSLEKHPPYDECSMQLYPPVVMSSFIVTLQP